MVSSVTHIPCRTVETAIPHIPEPFTHGILARETDSTWNSVQNYRKRLPGRKGTGNQENAEFPRMRK